MERWKPVVGYEGLYEVSDQGRVRSLDRWYDRPASRRKPKPWRRCYPGQMISLTPNGAGYPRVNLHRNRKREEKLVHWLVLEAFVGPCPDGEEGLHGNDIKTDNRLSNLRWGTRSDNVKDAIKNGRAFPFRRAA